MATSMLQAISSLDHQEETRILVILVMTWYHLITPDGTPQHPILGDVEHILACQGGNQITHSSTSHHPPRHHHLYGGMCGEEDEQGGMRGIPHHHPQHHHITPPPAGGMDGL